MSDFSETTPVLATRTEMDVGPAKVRRRLTRNVRKYRVTLDMTGTQVGIFDAFFVTTCAGGAIAFTWKQHRTGNVVDYRFVGQPEYVPHAPRSAGAEFWRVTMELEDLPGTEITGPVEPPPDPEGGFLIAMVPQPQSHPDSGEYFTSEDAEGVILDMLIFDAPMPGIDDMFLLQPEPDQPEDPPVIIDDLFIATYFPTQNNPDTSTSDPGSGSS